MTMERTEGTSLEELDLAPRAVNALRHGGIFTLEEAAQWSDRDLLSLPQMGSVSLASLRSLIGDRING